MAINANIALQGRGVELPDPVQRYGQMQQLMAGQDTQRMNAMKMQEAERGIQNVNAMNKAYSESLSPETGQLDYNMLMKNMAAAGQGSGIPGVMKQRQERQTAQLTFADEQRKFVDKLKLELSSNPSDDNVRAFGQDAVIQGLYPQETANRVVAQLLSAPPERRAQLLSQAGATVAERKPTLTPQTLGGASQIMSTPAFGGAATVVPGSLAQQQPFSPEVMAQKGRLAAAAAPKTAINLGGGKYAEAVGGGMGKADVDKYDFAQTIPSALTKVNETLDILKNSDINTGLGAEIFTTLDRARSKFAADKAAGVRVSNTEYLNSLIGSEVFPLIQTLGIGARGMDTPAEREFLREVMTGTIGLDKNTLIRMAELRKNAMVNAAKQYNSNVESGELDKFFEASGRNKSKIQIPANAPKPKEAAAQIPGGRGAPMFAVNPSTGQRIQSTDGGNTWTAVGGQ